MTTQTPELTPTAPETLPQFLTLLLKGILKRLPLKLAIAGGVALLAWIIHTYLLVVSNEGFAPGTSVWLDRILALQGRTITGTLVWTLAAGLITSTIARIITYGFNNTIRGIIETPRYILNWTAELGLIAVPLLIVGYLSTIFLGLFINNSLLVAQMWLIVLGIVIARHTSILITILRLGWSDAQRLLKREKVIPFNIAWPGIYFVGVLIGLLAILPTGQYLPYICGCLGFLLILLISAGIVVRSQGGTERLIGKKLILWILPPALLYILRSVTPAFADDGGWLEAGGTFSGWISSPGAGRAVLMGLLPAAGAGTGVLLGTALGSMVSIIGASGIPSAVSSLKPSAPGTTLTKGDAPLPSRTADHQVESLQQQEQISADPSRTADHQADPFQQQDKAAPGNLSERHQPSDPAERHHPDGLSEHDRPGGLSEHDRPDGLSERHHPGGPAQEADALSRTGDEAAEIGTSQRDLHGVQPQPASETGSTTGTAADSASRAQGFDQDSPADQLSEQPTHDPSLSQRHRPDAPDTPEATLSERHRPGGLTDQEADASPLTSRERPGGMAEDTPGGPTADRHTPDATGGPTAERHQPGGMSEDPLAKPARAEQPDLRAERHTPDVETGPTAERHQPGGMSEDPLAKPARAEQPDLRAERHTPDVETGPTAERHDPDLAPKDTIDARRASTDQPAPTAERFTNSETVQQPGPIHSRHTPAPEPALPLPPLPIPGYALDWELMVVRTPEDSGVQLQQRFELKEQTRIGRHGVVDIKLLDPKVSRQHADIEIQGSTCRITDLDSSNGTYVNGQRLTEPVELKHGDSIKIGDTYFVIHQQAE